jgi:hypothetical protein
MIEGVGEDPMLGAAVAAAQVRGFQEALGARLGRRRLDRSTLDDVRDSYLERIQSTPDWCCPTHVAVVACVPWR